MKFRPLHDRVVVERIDAEAKTTGGIIIPDTAKEKPAEGEVIAVGNGKANEKGEVRPLTVKKGDRVQVKLLERDERGRLRLSMKALVAKPEGEGQSGGEGGGRPAAMAAVGAQGEQSGGGESEGRPDRSSDRGDRPRRPRSGSRGGGGRSRE